ncbi:MAG TPA: biotin/lipoyl-containing protein, partial [Puia sp.]|nr:biotin/lipoyl-containing protein [Puia sp.]
MALVDLVMPKMGESIMEATILKWNKQSGEHVKQDETLLEIATDKVDSEVPSTAEGILEEILFAVNDVVPVGAVIARIRTAGEEKIQEAKEKVQDTKNTEQEEIPATQTGSVAAAYQQPSVNYTPAATNGTGNRFYSPLVLNIASNEGIPLAELESLHGSGNEGRVTKKDILQYVQDRKSGGGKRVSTPTTGQPYTVQAAA